MKKDYSWIYQVVALPGRCTLRFPRSFGVDNAKDLAKYLRDNGYYAHWGVDVPYDPLLVHVEMWVTMETQYDLEQSVNNFLVSNSG